MKKSNSVYNESAACTVVKSLLTPSLRPATIRTILLVLHNFFFRQYRAAWLPGRVPVSWVDHPLDLKIPFVPSWVAIYHDFSPFWIRMECFLLRRYGRRAFDLVREFTTSIGSLYVFAAEAYQKNFSTTKRPFYIARPRFLLIHLLDPHLMCIPSLHVMVVTWAYIKFAVILRSLGEADFLAEQLEEAKQGALAITQSILFVKQHSINCISAALYAITCFNGELFPPEKAEAFIGLLFGEPPAKPERLVKNNKSHPCAAPRTILPEADIVEIKAHIINLYRRFLEEGKNAQHWEEPLLRFMKQMPLKH